MLIGRGKFTKVYDNNDNTVTVLSSCPSKECYSLGWVSSSKEFGYDICLNPIYDFKDYKNELRCYISPKYEKFKKAKVPVEDYEVYKQLVIFSKKINRNNNIYDNLFAIIKAANNELSGWLKDFIISQAEAMGNFGTDIDFEISPRNVMVHNGRLVLLDLWFYRSKL